MTTPNSKYEKTQTTDAETLSKISCKIGDHFVNGYINTGCSISIASTELYRKLVDDQCTFKEVKGTVNLIDESIPNQEYRITTTTVKVIGQTKSINLVAFPNVFTPHTTLGIDFLTTKAESKSKELGVFRVPEVPSEAPGSKTKPVQEGIDGKNEPNTLLDWILDPNSLKKPLYDILADGTAEDDDLFAICAFMKRMPRMVSPISRRKKPSDKKPADAKSANVSTDKALIEPVTSKTGSCTAKITSSASKVI